MVFYSMCVLSHVNYDFLTSDVVLLKVCVHEKVELLQYIHFNVYISSMHKSGHISS
jgi:hypothetical protein